MEKNGWRRILYGVWATVEVLLFGGLVYGWPSLVFLLKQRNVYSNLCQQDVINPLRHNLSSAMNTSASTTTMTSIPSFLTGQTRLRDAGTGLAFQPSDTYSINLNISANQTQATPSYRILDENTTISFANNSFENSSDVSNEIEQELNCADQDAAFALGYTIVTAVTSIGSVGIGHAQRFLGMRATRVAFGLMYIAGLLMVGLVTPERPALLIAGMTCVALAGLTLLMTNIQLGGLFGRGQTTFVGLLSGCFDVSAIVQLLIKMVVSSGGDYLHTYIGMAVLNCLTLVSALLWLPKGPVVEVAKKRAEKETVDGREATPAEEQASAMTSYVTSPKLLSSLTSPLYILHVLWFSFLQLRLFFFVGVLNRWLTGLAHGSLEQVDHFTSVQLYTGCSSVLFAIMAGSLYDLQRHRYQASPTREQRLLGGAVLPLLLGSTCCLAVSLLVLVPVKDVLYLTFLLLAAYRSCMYSLAAAFLSMTFPAELFGVLYGTMVICGGMLGCLQYPLFIWSESSEDSILHVNILLLGFTLLTYVHPVHLLWRCRRSQTPETTLSTCCGDVEGPSPQRPPCPPAVEMSKVPAPRDHPVHDCHEDSS